MPKTGLLDRMIDEFTPEMDIATPAVVIQAQRNAQLRSAFLAEFGAIDSAAFNELTGGTNADNWPRRGKALRVQLKGRNLFPGFQFTLAGEIHPAVPQVLAILRESGASDWQAALWWIIPSSALHGARPVDVLLGDGRGDPGAFAEAAAASVDQDWF